MIEVFSLEQKQKWSEFLSELPLEKRDIYYTPDYYEIYERNGEGTSLCFCFRKDGQMAMYPFLLNSIPHYLDSGAGFFDIQGVYGYNGVVASDYSRKFASSFFQSFQAYCNDSNIIAEFTRFHPLLNNASFNEGFTNVIHDRKTVSLDLSLSDEEIWSTCYSSTNRNMIRKAIKNNIEVNISENAEDWYSFFEIYNETMTNVSAAGYYFFDLNYFENFRALLKGQHKLLVAKLNGEVICAMLLMFKNNYAHYHLSGRKKAFSNLGSNNFILHEAIQIAKKMNCKYFHFGGGTTSDNTDHLFRFKSNFSKETREFFIGTKIHNPEVYTKVISDWEKRNPENKQSRLILKYRY